MAGDPTFFEIGAPDGSRVRTFFGELFGWDVTPMNSDSFLMKTPKAQVGIHGGDESRAIGVYFSVPDLDAAIERVKELGGQVDPPRGGGGEFGRFIECQDDQGVRFGLHEPPRS